MKSKNLYVKSAKVQKCKTCGDKTYKNINKKHGKNGHGSCSIRKKCVPL